MLEKLLAFALLLSAVSCASPSEVKPAATSDVANTAALTSGKISDKLTVNETTQATNAGPIATNIEMVWTPEASKDLEGAPAFVRPIAKKRIEEKARAKGVNTITHEFVQEARKEMGR